MEQAGLGLVETLIGGSEFFTMLASPGATMSVRGLHWLNSRSSPRRSATSSVKTAQDSVSSTVTNLVGTFKDLSPQDMLRILSVVTPADLLSPSTTSVGQHPRDLTHVGRYLGRFPLPASQVEFLTRKAVETTQKRSFTSRRPSKSLSGGSTTQSSSSAKLQEVLGDNGNTLADWLKKAKLINAAPLKIVTDDHVRKYLTTDTSGKASDEEFVRARLAFLEGYLAANDGRVKGVKTPSLLRSMFFLGLSMLALTVGLAFLTGAWSFKVMMGLDQREVKPEDVHVTFEDVKGCDEAKEELMQIVEYLRNPDRFSALGGKLPKGVLLVGPPGTGKTLLARAVAGQAGVPFFQAVGSEFDEILVGQGARRVRDLFAAAKERAPCVIFIDEIDAVGSKRTNSVLHPHANQTINQLLAEMDGFHQTEGVIVLGATNRQEDLDRALTRPGRFDIEVHVSMPDLKGRSEILHYYMDKLVLAPNVKIDTLARGTAGFTGADIENMVNQAALSAASDGMTAVTLEYLEKARDKVLMGPSKKSRIPDEEANLITAYHEGGHTLVAHYTKGSMPLHKVTIIPRGPSLGHTAYLPEKEMYHQKKSEMMAMLDTLMAGRAAEELIFGTDCITSGASDDLRKASDLASNMVKMYGMSDKVGLRYYGREEERDILSAGKDVGPATAEIIDTEIKRILQESYERAKTILRQHTKEHRLIAEALMEHETLDADEIKSVILGQGMAKKGILA
ncbi:ATP-dependent zinc metalloprotease YME1-like protein [Hypsibius exemplaris]|uniref:ATP-dependent zinc metalloprotease YME1-like protein n=1 Tax=Hypsibius exemplaris TaxID=2072580 RepID=A0A1W0WLM1_HYPEX|nr:ATP-dependent zinc metalloprotease YME1-like protein [Hypsibius exemplaris]